MALHCAWLAAPARDLGLVAELDLHMMTSFRHLAEAFAELKEQTSSQRVTISHRLVITPGDGRLRY